VALAATVYMAAMGKHGLRDVANLCLQKMSYAKNKIRELKGYTIPFSAPTFKEFVVKTTVPSEKIQERLYSEKIIGGLNLGTYYPELKDHILLSVTEKRSRQDIERLIQCLSQVAGNVN